MSHRLLAPVALAVFLSVLAAPAIAVSETFYLKGDGRPEASLSLVPPSAGELPNFDPDRDSHPGLALARSGLGVSETDATRYQEWSVEASNVSISGSVTLVLWAAAQDFAPRVDGALMVYLLDCSVTGTSCETLATAIHEFETRSDWSETVTIIPDVRHEFSENRSLVLRVTVAETSATDLWLAYDRISLRSRLILSEGPSPFADQAGPADTDLGEEPLADSGSGLVGEGTRPNTVVGYPGEWESFDRATASDPGAGSGSILAVVGEAIRDQVWLAVALGAFGAWLASRALPGRGSGDHRDR